MFLLGYDIAIVECSRNLHFICKLGMLLSNNRFYEGKEKYHGNQHH